MTSTRSPGLPSPLSGAPSGDFLAELELAVDQCVYEHPIKRPGDPIKSEEKYRNAVRGDLVLAANHHKIAPLAGKTRARTAPKAPPLAPGPQARPIIATAETGAEGKRREREQLEAYYQRLSPGDRKAIDDLAEENVPPIPAGASAIAEQLRGLKVLTRRMGILEDLCRDRRHMS